MAETEIVCPSCKRVVAAARFLSACSTFHSDINSVLFECPECHKTTDARIEHGRISLGYIYAAGTAHYCGMEDYPVEGLQVWRDGEALSAELADATWTIRE